MSREITNGWELLPLWLGLLIFGVRSAVRKWQRSRQKKRWLAADGRLDRCEAASLNVDGAEVSGVRLYYSYTVKGEYRAGQVGEIGFSHGAQVEDFVRRFGSNTLIVVRYDPKNIDSSTLRLEDNPDLDVGVLAGKILENV